MIDKIKLTLWRIKNHPTFAGRRIDTEDYVRDVTYLLELVHKAQGMANEINLLTAENARQAEEIEMLRECYIPQDALKQEEVKG